MSYFTFSVFRPIWLFKQSLQYKPAVKDELRQASAVDTNYSNITDKI
jgi:hypothetical protein